MGQANSKDVDSPFEGDWQSLLGLVLVVAIGCVATTAGVGGGAIFVPIFQALVGFPIKQSTALSQALITAGAVVSVLLNLLSASPVDPSKPLIDFPLVLLLLPVLLVGVGLGVLLNAILPSYLISILLFLLMCLLITQSLGKGIRMWRAETRARKAAVAAAAAAAAAPPDAYAFAVPSPACATNASDPEQAGSGMPSSPFAAAAAAAGYQPQQQQQQPDRGPSPSPSRHSSHSSLSKGDPSPGVGRWFRRRGSRGTQDGAEGSTHGGSNGGLDPGNLGLQLTAEADDGALLSGHTSSSALRDDDGGSDSSQHGGVWAPAGPARVSVGAAGRRRPAASGGGDLARRFRPAAGTALPTLPEGDESDSWFARRARYLVRFVHACDEHGSEAHPMPTHPGPAFPRSDHHAQPDQQQQETVGGGGRQRHRRRHSWSLGPDMAAPLLSPEDSAAARTPHGRKKLLPPEQWYLAAGRTEEELLEALEGGGRGGGGGGSGGGGDGGEGTGGWSLWGQEGQVEGGKKAAGTKGRSSRPSSRAPSRQASGLLQKLRSIGSMVSRAGEAGEVEPDGGPADEREYEQHHVEVSLCLPQSCGGRGDGDLHGMGGAAGPREGAETGGLEAPLAGSAGCQPTPGPAGCSGDQQQQEQQQQQQQRQQRAKGLGAWASGVAADVREGWARLPTSLLVPLAACWAVYVGLQLARTLSRACSPAYWGIFAAQLFAMPAFSAFAAAWMEGQRRRRERKHLHALEMVCMQQPDEGRAPCEPDGGHGVVVHAEALEVQQQEQQVQPQPRQGPEGPRTVASFLLYQLLALSAGVIGGLLGLGGGMVIGPVLLEMGVQPQVSSATSSAMVLFSSSTALISLAAVGMVNVPYALVFSFASMIAAVLGVLLMGGLIRRTGRVSLLVLALATVMGVGGIAVGAFGVTIIISAVKSGNLGLSPLCK